MDPFSQGLLGAVVASSFSKKDNLKIASLSGALGGLFPDLDIFIRSNSDPLLFIDYHRNFTHSILFVPFGGLILSLILYLLFKKKKNLKQLFLFSTLGLFSHGLLDSCTTYGTNLFWPFSDYRVALNVISIVDPIFTLFLLVSLIFSLKYRSLIIIKVGLSLSLIYIFFGFIKNFQVKSYLTNIAYNRGHKIERYLLNPTFGNNFLWRTIYQFQNYYYVDAIYIPIFGDIKFKKGKKIGVINKNNVFPELKHNSKQREDIIRFSHFSMDYIYLYSKYKNVIGDLRYGTMPYDDNSLWGIEIDTNKPNKHVKFRNLRDFKKSDYKKFWSLIKGNI